MRRANALALALALACAGEPASARDQKGPDAGGATTAAAAAPAPATASQPTFTGPATAFAPESVTPYFATGVAAEAAAHFAIEEWQPARDKLAAFLASADAPADAAGRARVQYLVAICDTHLDRWADAAAGFDAAAAALPLLADYANYEAARAWYFAHDTDAALDRVGRVAADSVMDAEARLLRGDLLRAGGKWADVAKLYEDYLATYPNGMRLAEARYRLGEAYEHTRRAVPEALLLYRQVMYSAPLEAWSERAKERFDALLKQVKGKKKKKKYTQLTAEELIARGKVYFDGMRNPESEADYIAALKAPGLTPDLECVARYHRAQSVFKQRTRCKSAPFFDEAIEACAKVDNPDLQVRSAYQAGRGYGFCDDAADHKKGIARYDRAETWHPEHSFADDARLRQAELWAKLPATDETRAKVEELLSTIPEKYPQGDMRAEAIWRLAWRDWKEKNYEGVIAWLDKSLVTMPRDYNYWAEGQPHYWKGRAYEKLGKKDEARAAYERCAREYPLGYYALHALNRLREGWPKAFEALMADLKKPPRGWKRGTPAFTFKPRPVYGEPGFQRAVELTRMGLGAAAERELARLGLKPADGRAVVTDPDLAEQLWATALLYDRARLYDKSHWIARWSVLDYKAAWPTEANRARWDIAYPKAWWHLLEPAAREQGYPAELLIAFVREESAFDPIRESFANAIGLTQMIFPTAERFGKGLGFEITRENLRDPVKNVAIGSRFLAMLWKTFEQRVGLIVPAYNAGEGAVWKFLCQRGDWPLDEFAEQIPYDETRNYSKRVLNSYFIYTYLRDGSVPSVPNDIPPSVINQKRCR